MSDNPRVGEVVDYISPYRTGTFDAVIRNVRHDGTVDIEVYVDGLKGRVIDVDHIQTMRLRALAYGPGQRVRPR